MRNMFIIFLVSGFWHGANWTFVAWGALHALYFVPLLLLNKNRIHTEIVARGKYSPTIKEASEMLLTFCLTAFAWIFFRAENMGHAISYISGIISYDLFSMPYFLGIKEAALTALFVVLFVLVEWFGREQQYAIKTIVSGWKKPLQWGFYYLIAMLIFLFGSINESFIYFQF